MEIVSLIFKGFGSYRDLNEVIFPKGIVGIVGTIENDERRSNGSGKSTLIMAVIYALFGKGEFDRIEELVYDKSSDKNMFVKLKFSLADNIYIIERGYKKKSSYLDFFENGIPLTGKNINLTQDEIIRIVGMDYKMFTASVFFEQDKIDKFINVGSEERRSYVDKVLDLVIWRTAIKLVKKVIKEVSLKEENLRLLIRDANIEISDIDVQIQEKIMLQNKIKELQDEKKIQQQKLEKYSSISSMLEQLIKYEKELLTIQSELKDYIFKKNGFGGKILLHEKSVEGAELKLTDGINLQKTNKLSLDILKDDSKQYSDKLEKLSNDIFNISMEITNSNSLINSLNQSINNIKEGECPTCFQNVSGEYLISKSNELHLQVEDLTLNYNKSLDDKKIISNEKEAVVADIADLTKGIDKITEQMRVLDLQNNNSNTLILTGKKDITNVQNMLELLENRRIELIDREVNINNEIAIIKGNMPKSIPTENELELIRNDIDGFDKHISLLNIQIGVIIQLEKNQEKLKIGLISNESALKKCQEQISIYNIDLKLFQDILTQIFAHSIQTIQDAANEIIQRIYPEVLVKIYEDDTRSKRLHIAFEVDEKTRGYKRLSGGERIIVNIGLRLGFSKVIRSKSKSNIKFIVLDEPFGFLDEYNRDFTQKVFAMMLDWFKQIIVISHVDNVREFPNLIVVNKTPNGISYV